MPDLPEEERQRAIFNLRNVNPEGMTKSERALLATDALLTASQEEVRAIRQNVAEAIAELIEAGSDPAPLRVIQYAMDAALQERDGGSCPDCGAMKWGNATCATCRSNWEGGDPLGG